MNITYDEFKSIIKQGISTGEVKVTIRGGEPELTELDLAIQYVLGCEFEKKGETEIAMKEIPELILKYCGKEVFESVFSGELEEAENENTGRD